jgi:hypothetical protein
MWTSKRLYAMWTSKRLYAMWTNKRLYAMWTSVCFRMQFCRSFGGRYRGSEPRFQCCVQWAECAVLRYGKSEHHLRQWTPLNYTVDGGTDPSIGFLAPVCLPPRVENVRRCNFGLFQKTAHVVWRSAPIRVHHIEQLCWKTTFTHDKFGIYHQIFARIM